MAKFKVTLRFGKYQCVVEAQDKEDAKIQALVSHRASLPRRIIGWWMGASKNAEVEELET